MRKISAYARIVHYKELRTRKGTGADEILVKFMSLWLLSGAFGVKLIANHIFVQEVENL